MYSLYIFLGKLMTFTVFPKKCSRDLGRISGNESRSPEGFQKEATEKTQVLRSSLNDEVMTTAGQKGTHRRTAGSRESTVPFPLHRPGQNRLAGCHPPQPRASLKRTSLD